MLNLGQHKVWSRLDRVMKMQRSAVVRIVSPKRLWLWRAGIENGQDVRHTASTVIIKLVKSANSQKGQLNHLHISTLSAPNSQSHNEASAKIANWHATEIRE
jgi:hypothetical protein